MDINSDFNILMSFEVEYMMGYMWIGIYERYRDDRDYRTGSWIDWINKGLLSGVV